MSQPVEKERKIGVILTYVTLGVQALINFVYIRFLLGFMGESEYGLYQTMGAFIAYFSIMDFGLSSAVIRFYSKYKALDDRKSMENVLSLSSIIYSIITALILIIGVVVYFQLDRIYANSFTAYELDSSKKIFIVLLINIAITIPSKIFDAVITSYEKFSFIKIMTLIQTIFQPFVVIAVMTISPTAYAMVMVQTLFNVLLISTKILYTFRNLQIRFKIHYLDKGLLRSMMQFSFFIFLQAIMDQLFWQSNKVIISIIISTTAVAIYGVAYQIITAYVSFSTAFTGVFLPKVTKIAAKKEDPKILSDFFIKIGRMQYLILLTIVTGFIAFGKTFIMIISDFDINKVNEVYIIVLFLMIPYSIDLIQNIGLTIMQAYNKLAFRSITFLAMAIINVILSVILGLKFGVIGCAFSTGFCCFVANIAFLNPYYHKHIKINILEFWKQILKITIPGIICLVVGIGIQNILNFGGGIFDLLVKIIIYLIVYATMMWFFAMNSYEKSIISAVIKKLFGALSRRTNK